MHVLGALNAHHKIASSRWKMMIIHWLWFWGIHVACKLTSQSVKHKLPNIWQFRYLTHPRLGNQPMAVHGSAYQHHPSYPNVSWSDPEGNINHLGTWGSVFGFVCRFRGFRHSSGLKPPRDCHLQHTMHPRSPHFRPSCRGEGVLSAVSFDANLWTCEK